MWRAGLGATLAAILALALAVIAAPGAFGEDNSTQVADACQAVTTLELKVKSEGENAPSGEPGGGFKGAVARIGKSISDLEKEGDQEGFVRISVRPKLAKLADGSYRVTLEIVQKAIPARLSEADRNKVAVILAALAGWSHTISANDKSAEADGSRTIRLYGPFKTLAQAGVPGADSLVVKLCLPDDIPNCTSMTLAYEPASLFHLERAKPRLTYIPNGCRAPSAEVRYEILEQTNDNGWNRIARLTPDGVLFAEADTDGKVTIKVSLESLAAKATVTLAKRPKCQEMKFDLNSEMSLGDWNFTPVKFGPPGCIEPDDRELSYSSINRDVADYDKSNARRLFALKKGTATVVAKWNKGGLITSAEVVVGEGGPDCNGLYVSYPSSVLTVGYTTGLKPTGVSPLLTYAPAGCAPPAGRPEFNGVNSDVLKVEAATGIATAVKPGSARVVVRHGEKLFATANIEVVDVPDCDRVNLSFEPGALPLRSSANAMIRYETLKSLPSDLCRPPARQIFTSDHPSVIEVDAKGKATALSFGSATVSLAHAGRSGLVAYALLEVKDGPPCQRFWNAYYAPSAVAVGGHAALTVRYDPYGCVPSAEALKAEVVKGDGEVHISADKSATGVKPGKVWIQITHGDLRHEAQLAVSGSCADFTSRVESSTINLQGQTVLTVIPEPEGCTSSPGDLSATGQEGLEVDRVEGYLFRIGGRVGGDWTVHLSAFPTWGTKDNYINKYVPIHVEAPQCTEISLRYTLEKLHPYAPEQNEREVAKPTIEYLPENCTRPAGVLTFESSAANFVVDDKGNVTIHPRSASESSTTATIHVRRGNLSAHAKLYIVE